MERQIIAKIKRDVEADRSSLLGPIFLALLVAAIGAISVLAIEQADAQRRELELDRNLTEIATVLQRRVNENTAILRAGAALFQQEPVQSEEAFEEFVADVQDDDELYGSLGFGWAPLVPVSQLATFELSSIDSGETDYLVRPRPEPGQQVAVPVLHLVPATRLNRRAIGYDLYSEPVRRAAIDAAIDQRRPVASGKLTLLPTASEEGPPGFLIFMPVRSVRGTGEVRGMVYTPIDADEFLRSASALVRDREIEVELYDQAVAPENLLARRRLQGTNGQTLQRRIEVAGRTWVVTASRSKTPGLSLIGWLATASAIVISLLVLVIGVLRSRRTAANQRMLEVLTSQSAIRDSLTRELNHRVKNTLANVLSIASLTRARSKDIDEFHTSLTARIRALSATHDLLSQSNWNSAPLRDVVSSELAPYMRSGDENVSLRGPDIALAPNDAMSLGLAIHELATNAAKYGALSVSNGRVDIRWDMIERGIAVLDWRETGGPRVEEPTSRGFGRDLIEKIVAHELGSEVELSFKPEGVQCSLYVPVRRAAEFALRGRGVASRET